MNRIKHWFWTDIFGHGRERALFRQIVESSPNAIVLAGRDGRITLVNAQTEKMFLYPREELIGQPVEVLVPVRFRAAHPAHRMAFFGNPSVRSMGAGRDLFGLRRDGTEFPVEIGLNPIADDPEGRVLASIIDITERKRAEERFRRVVEAAPNAIIVVGRDGRMLMVNAQAEKLFGFAREEMVGQSVDILVPQRFRSMHGGYRASYFAHPSDRPMGAGRDLFGLRRDGSEFPVEIGLNAIQGDDDTLVLVSIIDITERKRAEQGLRELMQEMQAMVDVLSSSTNDILTAVSQLTATSVETATAVNQTTSTVEEVKQTAILAANKARQVSDTANQSSEISQHGREAVLESIDSMQRIHAQMISIAQSTARLLEHGQSIADIINTVNDLAEQSNVLAVNAAIEAAKAGEHGKGFSVVAQEIKSLAEQSKAATTQVRQILRENQNATQAAVAATEQGSRAVESGMALSRQAGDAITHLSSSIEQATEAATQIAVSAQQQLVGIDQAVMAIRSIGDASTQNVDSTRQTERVAHQLHELGLKLKRLVEQA